MSTLETSLKLVVRVGEVVLDVLVLALVAGLLVEVEAIPGIDVLLLGHSGEVQFSAGMNGEEVGCVWAAEKLVRKREGRRVIFIPQTGSRSARVKVT